MEPHSGGLPDCRAELLGERLDGLWPAVQFGGRVLQRADTPGIALADGDKQLHRVAVGHHVVPARRDHADRSMQQRGIGADGSHAANDADVPGNSMVRKDGSELLGDLAAALHLTAVEPHHDRVVTEVARVTVGVLAIPGIEDRAVEPLNVFRGGVAGHGTTITRTVLQARPRPLSPSEPGAPRGRVMSVSQAEPRVTSSLLSRTG